MADLASKDLVFEVIADIQKELGEAFLSNYKWHNFNGDYNVVKLENQSDIVNYIDHTHLNPAADTNKIRQFCKDALEFKFASLCVNSNNVKTAFQIAGSIGLEICSVVGFPTGAHLAAIKAHEAELAIYDGASEIDTVINIGALKGKEYKTVYQDIVEVTEICHSQSAILKVIIETCKLDQKEKIAACLLSFAAGADYVKTSTGMAEGGATEDDITLMRQVVGPEMGVKASGGIRDLKKALAMIKAGATRIGAGAGDKIAQEANNQD